MEYIQIIKNLTIEEIKRMLLATIKNDSYHAKCFLNLLIKERENTKEEIEIFEYCVKLISRSKVDIVLEQITNL